MHNICAHNKLYIFAENLKETKMKNILITLMILFTTYLFSQDIVSDIIISINTKEKVNKKITVSENNHDFKTYYTIIAENKSTREYRACKWKSHLSCSEMNLFINQLDDILNSEKGELKGKAFHIKKVGDKAKIKFVNTICNAKHKTHYFQKTCTQSLSFVLSNSQQLDLIDSMRGVLVDKEQARK